MLLVSGLAVGRPPRGNPVFVYDTTELALRMPSLETLTDGRARSRS